MKKILNFALRAGLLHLFSTLCITEFKSQGLYTIKIKYWNASGSGFPPSLIPALWNIGILLHKQATWTKHFCPECKLSKNIFFSPEKTKINKWWQKSWQKSCRLFLWQTKRTWTLIDFLLSSKNKINDGRNNSWSFVQRQFVKK